MGKTSDFSIKPLYLYHMCYSVAFLANKASIYEKRYSLFSGEGAGEGNQAWPASYFLSGFTHPVLPLITSTGIEFSRWGLIPHWAKDAAQASTLSKNTLNAMGETIFEKPSFRHSALHHRAILGVSGFFEWREYEKKKYPYFIHAANNDLLSLACITSQWHNPADGQQIKSFSIVTTDANGLLSQIHNSKKRMPLVLHGHEESDWLNDSLPKEKILAMAKPCEENLLKAHTISLQAGNPRINRNEPWVIEPVQYDELPKPIVC